MWGFTQLERLDELTRLVARFTQLRNRLRDVVGGLGILLRNRQDGRHPLRTVVQLGRKGTVRDIGPGSEPFASDRGSITPCAPNGERGVPY